MFELYLGLRRLPELCRLLTKHFLQSFTAPVISQYYGFNHRGWIVIICDPCGEPANMKAASVVWFTHNCWGKYFVSHYELSFSKWVTIKNIGTNTHRIPRWKSRNKIYTIYYWNILGILSKYLILLNLPRKRRFECNTCLAQAMSRSFHFILFSEDNAA